MIRLSKRIQLTGHKASIFAVGPDRETTSFLSAGGDGWIVRWNLDDPETGKLIARVDTQVFALLYLPDKHWVIAGDMNGGVHWVDLEHPDRSRHIAHHQKGTFGICRINDHVFTAGGQGMLTRWSIPGVRSLESIQLTHASLRSLAYSPERNELAVGASDNCIYLLDAETMAVRHRQEQAHDNSVFSVHYHPDGRHLITGGRDAHLRIWSLTGQGLEPYKAMPAHYFTINSIAFHPEGRWFATGSRDKTIKLWDAETFELKQVLETSRDGCHLNSVNNLFWSPYGNQLVSASDDRSIILWQEEENGRMGEHKSP